MVSTLWYNSINCSHLALHHIPRAHFYGNFVLFDCLCAFHPPPTPLWQSRPVPCICCSDVFLLFFWFRTWVRSHGILGILFSVSFPLENSPKAEQLDHMVLLSLMVWGTSILPIVSAPISIASNSAQCPLSFVPRPILVVSCLLGTSRSDRFEVISHCDYDLRCPGDWGHWTLFHVPVGHLCVICKIFYLNSLLIFNWVIIVCFWGVWVLNLFYILTACQCRFANNFICFTS